MLFLPPKCPIARKARSNRLHSPGEQGLNTSDMVQSVSNKSNGVNFVTSQKKHLHNWGRKATLKKYKAHLPQVIFVSVLTKDKNFLCCKCGYHSQFMECLSSTFSQHSKLPNDYKKLCSLDIISYFEYLPLYNGTEFSKKLFAEGILLLDFQFQVYFHRLCQDSVSGFGI